MNEHQQRVLGRIQDEIASYGAGSLTLPRLLENVWGLFQAADLPDGEVRDTFVELYSELTGADDLRSVGLASDADVLAALTRLEDWARRVGDDWGDYEHGDARYRRLHRGVRIEPETVWAELRAYLCEPTDNPTDLDRVDLVEDLMFWHAEQFIERIERLVEECPSARLTVAWSDVGGVAGPAVERFNDFAQRLLRQLEEQGVIQAWRPPSRDP